MISLIRAPGKQQTFLKSGSGQQMGASVPLRRESPATITCNLFLVGLIDTKGADQSCLTQLHPPWNGSSLFGQQRGEVVP